MLAHRCTKQKLHNLPGLHNLQGQYKWVLHNYSSVSAHRLEQKLEGHKTLPGLRNFHPNLHSLPGGGTQNRHRQSPHRASHILA